MSGNREPERQRSMPSLGTAMTGIVVFVVALLSGCARDAPQSQEQDQDDQTEREKPHDATKQQLDARVTRLHLEGRCKTGDPTACFEVAYGTYLRKEYDASFSFAKIGCELDAPASWETCELLAVLYRDGLGVASSIDLATNAALRARELGKRWQAEKPGRFIDYRSRPGDASP